jgi:hypothetical protein
LAAGFFAAGAFFGAAAFLAGLAAFGFATFGLAAAFGFATFGLAGAAFLATFATAGFFADFATGFLIFVGLPAAFGFLATDFLTTFFFSPAAFLGLADFGFTAFGFFGAASFLAAAGSLNEPDAPFPFVCKSCPLATADFKNFLMNGANFSTSTLYWAARYFLMAWSDEPPRSFSVLTAATTISLTGGWVFGAFGFFGFADADFAAFFGGEAGFSTGAATGAGSDILFLLYLTLLSDFLT